MVFNLKKQIGWPTSKQRKRKTGASQRLPHKQMKKRRSSRGMSGSFGDPLGSSSDEEDLYGHSADHSDGHSDGVNCGCQYLNMTGKGVCMRKVLVSYRSWRRESGEAGNPNKSGANGEELSDSLKKKEMEIISGFQGMQLGEG